VQHGALARSEDQDVVDGCVGLLSVLEAIGHPSPASFLSARSRESSRRASSASHTSTPRLKRRQRSSSLHPRWSFQFTPTHASWLNQVEIFFSILQRRLLKHGAFDSEQDLAEQMLCFVETYNQTATPFQWTYTGKVLSA